MNETTKENLETLRIFEGAVKACESTLDKAITVKLKLIGNPERCAESHFKQRVQREKDCETLDLKIMAAKIGLEKKEGVFKPNWYTHYMMDALLSYEKYIIDKYLR